MSDILIIGSLNVDHVISTNIIPKPGETLFGDSYKKFPGGKGANQAVAASRLDGNVELIGCIGNDDMGKYVTDNLQKNNVICKNIKVSDKTTGLAQIIVSDGENSIIVIPGSNFDIDIEYIKNLKELILKAKLVVLQLEIPLSVIEYIINFSYDNNIDILLNPAPAIKLEKSLLKKCTYITPNEHECEIVFNSTEINNVLKDYPNKLLITEGSKGVRYYDGKNNVRVPAFKVDVKDTTGAGDTFNGALSVALTKGKSLKDAIIFANKAASYAVTQMGAQSGMPYLEDINK